VTDTALTAAETTRLTDLERRIERTHMSFVDAGEALREIRDGRLYRAIHGTFDEYCEARWGLTRSQGHRLIAAAEVVTAIRMSPIGDILPATETQARELTRLEDPEQQVKAWERVIERTNSDAKCITAKIVREEVQRLLPEKEEPVFLVHKEHAVIMAWLLTRIQKWPEYLQPTFRRFMGGILEQLDDELSLGNGAAVAQCDPSSSALA
jgi:hypothetical protein